MEKMETYINTAVKLSILGLFKLPINMFSVKY